MFDIHGGDVIREKHDLVGMEFTGVFRFELGLGNLPHDAHDEVAGAHKRVEDMDAFSPKGAPEFGAEQMVHGAHNELDDGLGGVDDAVGVSHLYREALEEAFVNGVQEALLLGVIFDGGRSGFDGVIEAGLAFSGTLPD